MVSMLNASHVEVILAMVASYIAGAGKKHSSGSSSTNGGGTVVDPAMADAANGPDFWSSVATTFLNAPGVIYDLYGEPQEISWQCWKYGCTIGGLQVTGMQELISAVRATGSKQPLMLGGLDYANDLSDWLTYEPTDPDHQLIASVHVYPTGHCNYVACWNDTLTPVAQDVPVVTGEFGASGCDSNFVTKYMNWADQHGISYLLWAWIAGTCPNSTTLMPAVSNYSGTPTSYGETFMQHVAELYQAGGGVFGVGPTTAGTASSKQ
jgi:hypothetical protein